MTDEEFVAVLSTLREPGDRVEVIADRVETERVNLLHEYTPIRQQMIALLERQLEALDLSDKHRRQFQEMKREFLDI
jgi:hypothetical protein